MWNLVLSGLSGILLGVFFSMDRSFPVGLYEEKLLERVIRVEVLLKDTMEKITETNVRIKDDRIKLNEAIHAQLEDNKQERNSIITALDLSFLDKVESFIAAATENITATFEKMNSTITSRNEGQSVMHQVMFHVLRPGVSDSGKYYKGYKYGINETIVFELAMYNEVAGYDLNTGHFMAPEAGVHMFTLQYFSVHGYFDPFQIVKEGRVLPKSLQMNGANCFSVRAFAVLALGDKVWVKSTYEADVLPDEISCRHSFSGMIVRL